MPTIEPDLLTGNAFVGGIPHDHFRRLRARAGLTSADDGHGHTFWHVVRHRDVVEVVRDPHRFSSWPSTMTSVREVDQELPIITFLDPPAHHRLRRLIGRGFVPGRLRALRGRVGEIVRATMADAVAAGTFDFAEQVALTIPYRVLAALLDLTPTDADLVLGWTRRTLSLGDPDNPLRDPAEVGRVYSDLFGFFAELLRRRRAVPADDLLSVLARAEVKGDRLSDKEICDFATMLMAAGSESTYCALTGALLTLLEHPEQAARLRTDRSLLPTAVDEILRWVSPVTHSARRVTEGTTLAGRPLRAGDRVVLWFASANRDELVFAAPDTFDPARPRNPHLAFGDGPHVCLGGALAAAEIRYLLDEILDLLPRLSLAGPVVRTETNFMNSVKRLPVRVN